MYPSAMRSKLMYQAMLKARESRELPSRVSRVAWADEAAAAVGIQEISISSGGRRKDLNWGLSQLRLLGEVNPFSHSSHVSGSSGYHHISEVVHTNGNSRRSLNSSRSFEMVNKLRFSHVGRYSVDRRYLKKELRIRSNDGTITSRIGEREAGTETHRDSVW